MKSFRFALTVMSMLVSAAAIAQHEHAPAMCPRSKEASGPFGQ